MINNNPSLFAVPAILLLLLLLLSFSSSLSVIMAQPQTGGATTTIPSPSPLTAPPLTPEEQEQQNRLQNVIAATNQNLDEAEKQIGGVVYTPRWSNPVWVEPGALSILFVYCLPGEFAESGQEILGGFELEVLESYEIALAQGFMAWMMVIGNEDRQDRLPAAVGVICASDTNDVETRVLSPQEQQQINNVVQQFVTTQVTNIEQVINIINNVTSTTPQNGNSTTPTTPDTTPPVLDVAEGTGTVTATPEGSYANYYTYANDNYDGTATLDLDNTLIQDDVGGDITISCDPPPTFLFPVGVTTVQCTATDAAGNVGTASFTVTVRLLGTPPPTTGNDTGGGGPPGPIVPGVIPNATITSEADTIPPIVQGPNSIRLPAKGLEGTEVTYGVIAEDNVDGRARLDDDNILSQDTIAGAITLSCNPPSGSIFPVGTITVQCTATDAAGNTGTYSFTITVVRSPFGALQGEEQQQPSTPPTEEEEQQPPPVADEGAAAAPVTEEEQSVTEEEEEATTTSPPANEGGG